MRQLSMAGQQLVNDIARRHGFSVDAVTSMLDSVLCGNGSMAQFNHQEFGGAGQWMQGGMTMLSDMFNNYLKGRVDNLCAELSRVVVEQPGLVQTGSFQSQTQGCGQQQWNGSSQPQGGMDVAGHPGLFVPPAPGTSGNWWPADLGLPDSSGSQNDTRYAWFSWARRLAIDVGGQVTVYDTLNHQIGGVSQQQSGAGTLGFTSQYGLIDVASLPVVSIDGVAPTPQVGDWRKDIQPIPAFNVPAPAPMTGTGEDIFAAIEKLAALHGRGILSNEEFAAKKAELLARL